MLKAPTAAQSVVDVHDTSAKDPPAAPAGSPADHLVPFQRSANGPDEYPTATQALADLHDTLLNELSSPAS
jgi:hypothetical protein